MAIGWPGRQSYRSALVLAYQAVRTDHHHQREAERQAAQTPAAVPARLAVQDLVLVQALRASGGSTSGSGSTSESSKTKTKSSGSGGSGTSGSGSWWRWWWRLANFKYRHLISAVASRAHYAS